MSGLGAMLAALGGAAPGAYQTARRKQQEITEADTDALSQAAMGNALKLFGQGGGPQGPGAQGGMPMPPQGPPPQPPSPGQPPPPPGPPQGPPPGPGNGPPGGFPPPGGPPQGIPPWAAGGLPGAPPVPPMRQQPQLMGAGQPQMGGGPMAQPPGPPRPQPPMPPQPPGMGGGAPPGAGSGPSGAGGMPVQQVPGGPPGGFDWRQMIKQVFDANPGIDPKVAAGAVTKMLPFMTMASRQEWLMAHNQLLQQQLEANTFAKLRGQDIGLEKTREGIESREGIAGENRASREQMQTERLRGALQRTQVSTDGKMAIAQFNAQNKAELADLIEQKKDIRANASNELKRELATLKGQDIMALQKLKGEQAEQRQTERITAQGERQDKTIAAQGERQDKALSAAQTRVETQQAGADRRAALRRAGNPFAQLGPDGKYEMKPEDMDKAIAISRYQARPLNSSADNRNPQSQAIMAAARKIAPDFNEGGYGLSNTTEAQFEKGAQGNTIRSIGVAQRHLDTLVELTDALDNNNLTLANRVANAWGKAFGATIPADLEAAKQVIAAEVIKAVSASGGGVKERLEMAHTLDPLSLTGEQSREVANTFRNLLDGQIKGFRAQWKSTPRNQGKSDADFDKQFGIEKRGDSADGAGAKDTGGWKIEKINPQQAPKLGG